MKISKTFVIIELWICTDHMESLHFPIFYRMKITLLNKMKRMCEDLDVTLALCWEMLGKEGCQER